MAQNDHARIQEIIDELSRDFAYAIHHPNFRNGGLIGLAAAAIALGQNEVSRYLDDIIHPVLACFGDQDARVRYYACESMYNVAKVAKGEILRYFNEIFDALSRLVVDSDHSVKSGADLLDRLIKDIVAEKASSYVSVIAKDVPEPQSGIVESDDPTKPRVLDEPRQTRESFSLVNFIPLLTERMYADSPFARMFFVSWITLLDSIPDLELVAYLPHFLGGLLSFLSDNNKDVRVATLSCLDGFLQEIRRITEIKNTVAERRRELQRAAEEAAAEEAATAAAKGAAAGMPVEGEVAVVSPSEKSPEDGDTQAEKSDEGPTDSVTESTTIPDTTKTEAPTESSRDAQDGGESNTLARDSLQSSGGTVQTQSDGPSTQGENAQDGNNNDDKEEEEEEEEEDFYIPGQDVVIDFDKIIEILMAHLDNSMEQVQLVALAWIEALLDVSPGSLMPYGPRFLSVLLPTMAYDGATLRTAAERVNQKLKTMILNMDDKNKNFTLDYTSMVNALTLHFLDEKEQTRVAALDWLIMLHRKVPKQVLAINDGTFPALLKTLSDPSEAVITKDLQLLAQISYESDDEYFTEFMVNLLNLFSTDRRLLETRGNLIIRQLCISLSPERIYCTLAEILEKDDDVEFASIMVVNLNNNLITAPELSELRRCLRNLNTKEGASLFVVLFRSWCHSSAAALSLCLLAQAYEHAFQVLQILVEFDVTVSLLVQIDKLVQLLESPVFTQLRLQLLEPEKYPYLYKVLYGILMLLPQSSAFNVLRNRLNAVSAIGYVHLPSSRLNSSVTPKLRSRDEVNWADLLEKFRSVQRRLQSTRNPAKPIDLRPKHVSTQETQPDQSIVANKLRKTPDATVPSEQLSTSPKKDKEPSQTVKRFTARGPFSLRRASSEKRKK